MITKALQTLRPTAQWSLSGDNYSGLEWLDAVQTKPTEDEINAEIVRLEAEYTATQYQRDRVKAYPSIGNQLDMIYHAGLGGDVFQAAIKAIKDQFPKGAN